MHTPPPNILQFHKLQPLDALDSDRWRLLDPMSGSYFSVPDQATIHLWPFESTSPSTQPNSWSLVGARIVTACLRFKHGESTTWPKRWHLNGSYQRSSHHAQPKAAISGPRPAPRR